MKETRTLSFCLCAFAFLFFACSDTKQAYFGFSEIAQDMMTAQDFLTQDFSNVRIINGTNTDIISHGLFIASYDINDCSACFGSVVAGDNVGGTFVQPITFKANGSVPIGKNYLYNLIYNGIYYIKNNVGSSPCQLPGCSWPGDDPNVHGWCITLNAMGRSASYNHSNYALSGTPASNAIPYSAAGNSIPFDYQYDLFDPSTLGSGNSCIGPVACDDETLTCSVSSTQTQTFQAY